MYASTLFFIFKIRVAGWLGQDKAQICAFYFYSIRREEGEGRYSWEAYYYIYDLYVNRYVKNMECWNKTQVILRYQYMIP